MQKAVVWICQPSCSVAHRSWPSTARACGTAHPAPSTLLQALSERLLFSLGRFIREGECLVHQRTRESQIGHERVIAGSKFKSETSAAVSSTFEPKNFYAFPSQQNLNVSAVTSTVWVFWEKGYFKIEFA